jgi:hypothetical protein
VTPEQVITKIVQLSEDDEDLEVPLLAPREDFDKCLVGVARRFNSTFAVYSQKCVLEVLAEGMDDDPEYPADLSAREFFEFNTIGGWIGEGTPAFLQDEED